MNTTAVKRLNKFIKEGRLIRNKWTSTDDKGRETACLLAALSPKVAKAKNASACPATIMPQWFAEMTPWIDDNCSAENWQDIIKRYADLAGRWQVLSKSDWKYLEASTKRISVMEAIKYTSDKSVLEVCQTVIKLLEREMEKDSPTAQEWSAAADAARSAASAAASAAWSAESAASAASAAWSAAWSAAASAAWSAAESAAWSAARSAAVDSIIYKIFDAFEKVISKAEGGK